MNVLRVPARLRSHNAHIRRFSTTAPKSTSKPIFALRFALASAAHIFLWSTAGVLLTNHFFPISGPLLKAPLPIHGSPEDKKILGELEAFASNLAVVKALRADPEYHEHKPWRISEEERRRHYTPGVLQGAEKIGYNRVWVKKDGSTVGVFSLGRGICGFPNVIVGHSMAVFWLRKIIDEALGRTAITVLPTRNAVTARLSVNYRRPTKAHLKASLSGFVILRTFVVEYTDRKSIAKATIEDEFGNLLADGEGIFVVPRNWKLVELPVDI